MADVTVTAKNVRLLPGAIAVSFKAGGSLNVGDAVYLASDGDVEQADADAAASAQVIGVVVSAPNGATSAVAGDPVDVVVHGRVCGFSGLTPGALLYASTTAGKIADAAPAASSGDYKWIVGRAVTATTILVAPFTDDFAAQ